MTETAKKPRATKVSAKAADTAPELIGYKGFDKDLKCRGYQYEIGKTHRHEGAVSACNSGLHLCTNPFHVWSYYPPKADNRFAEVRYGGKVASHDGDSKLAVEELTVSVELTLPAFIRAGIAVLFKRAEDAKAKGSGNYSTSATSGDYSTSIARGSHSIAVSGGRDGCVMAERDGNLLVAVERDRATGAILSHAAEIVGTNGILAGVFYQCRGGKLVEDA